LFRRSQGADAATPSPPLPGLTVQLHPLDIELFTSDGIGDVQLLAGSGRITELLNGPEPMRIRSRPEEPGGPEADWIEVDVEQRDEILAVIPPPRDTNPLQRLHRPAQEVSLRVGPYTIIGEAHVPAGSEATGFLMRHRPHFVPLTHARISQTNTPDVKAQVVIVNLWAAESLTMTAPADVVAEPSDAPAPEASAPDAPMPEAAPETLAP
jgi:hypothetical protein